MACAIGSEDIVDYLMDEGVEVNLQETTDLTVPIPTRSYVVPKLSPLHLAVYSNNIELISTLAAKADINFQDQLGFTALHYATMRRNKDIVLLLLDLGASAIIESKVCLCCTPAVSACMSFDLFVPLSSLAALHWTCRRS
jgi:ankyrin repeat protein